MNVNKAMLINISDNYEFHKREYLTIRPNIKNHLMSLNIDCTIKASNPMYFLMNDTFDINDEDDILEILQNDHATQFITQNIESIKLIDIIRHHSNAIHIVRPMLDAIVVFIKYVSVINRVKPFIEDDEFIQTIIYISHDHKHTIKSGLKMLKGVYSELNEEDITWAGIIKIIAMAISSYEQSTDYLKRNRIFIDDDSACRNKRCNELLTIDEMIETEIWWCFNEDAWKITKLVHSSQIEWDMILTFCNNNAFIQTNLHRYDLNDEITCGNLIGNKYLADLIHKQKTKLLTFSSSDFVKYNASYNPSLIHFIEEHTELINEGILQNPNIITYDYETITNYKKDLHKDLIEYLHQPRFIQKWIEQGNNIEDYLI